MLLVYSVCLFFNGRAKHISGISYKFGEKKTPAGSVFWVMGSLLPGYIDMSSHVVSARSPLVPLLRDVTIPCMQLVRVVGTCFTLSKSLWKFIEKEKFGWGLRLLQRQSKSLWEGKRGNTSLSFPQSEQMTRGVHCPWCLGYLALIGPRHRWGHRRAQRCPKLNNYITRRNRSSSHTVIGRRQVSYDDYFIFVQFLKVFKSKSKRTVTHVPRHTYAHKLQATNTVVTSGSFPGRNVSQQNFIVCAMHDSYFCCKYKSDNGIRVQVAEPSDGCYGVDWLVDRRFE